MSPWMTSSSVVMARYSAEFALPELTKTCASAINLFLLLESSAILDMKSVSPNVLKDTCGLDRHTAVFTRASDVWNVCLGFARREVCESTVPNGGHVHPRSQRWAQGSDQTGVNGTLHNGTHNDPA